MYSWVHNYARKQDPVLLEQHYFSSLKKMAVKIRKFYGIRVSVNYYMHKATFAVGLLPLANKYRGFLPYLAC